MIGLPAGCGNGGQQAPATTTVTTTSSPSSLTPSPPTEKDITPPEVICRHRASKRLHLNGFHQASSLASMGFPRGSVAPVRTPNRR